MAALRAATRIAYVLRRLPSSLKRRRGHRNNWVRPLDAYGSCWDLEYGIEVPMPRPGTPFARHGGLVPAPYALCGLLRIVLEDREPKAHPRPV
jgi:hypothetical protein